jgi:hypothetical protein
MATHATRFPGLLRVKTPEGLADLIREIAARNHTTPSAWARGALINALRMEGLNLTEHRQATKPTPSRAA